MNGSIDASDAPSMIDSMEASIATKQNAEHEQHQQQEVAMDLLLHAAAQQGHRVPAGALQQQRLLASLSHLHLNGLQLTQLHSLKMCPKLQVWVLFKSLDLQHLLAECFWITFAERLSTAATGYWNNVAMHDCHPSLGIQWTSSLMAADTNYMPPVHTRQATSTQHSRFMECCLHIVLSLFAAMRTWILQVLYVYDNLLSNISSIAGNRLLTHLYCHNNLLTSLQGVEHLPLLQKLYAQGNCLTSLEGLSHTQHLQELHVSDQQPWAAAGQHQLQHLHQQNQQQGAMLLPHAGRESQQQQQQQQQQQPALKQPQQDQMLLINDGALMQHVFTSAPPTPLHDAAAPPDAAAMAQDACPAAVGAAPGAGLSSSSSSRQSSVLSAGLCLEPASLAAMKGSLRVLAAANCGITDPRPLAVLTRLQVLDLAGNAIASLAVLQPMLEALGQLQDLDLSRNPCVHSSGSRYRDSIILAASDSLRLLDGEEVKHTHRAFLLALHSRRLKARQQQPEQDQDPLLAEQASIASEQQAEAVVVPQRAQAADIHRAGMRGEVCGPGVTGVKLQLPVALQPCRAAGARPTAAGGFRQSPRRGRKEMHSISHQPGEL